MVYVVQEQIGKNILPAQKFGEIKILFPPDFQVGLSAGQATQRLMFEMSDFTKEDYLLLIGDPVVIGIATAVASHWSNGKVKLLKWDRHEKIYYPVSFDLHFEKGESKDGTKEKENFG